MQTFLPRVCFSLAAECLDNKRLGKQRVETKQILIALGVDVGEHAGNAASRWRNHPAVCMWRGHEALLAHYGLMVCHEWRRRGFRDTLLDQFSDVIRRFKREYSDTFTAPWWLGNQNFHASHRSNLLRKDPAWYSQFNWAEPDDLPYVWPTVEVETETEVAV